MKKIVDFDVNAEHYTVDAVFIWCFDRRFEGLETGVMKHYGFSKIDPVNVAGGVKDLAGTKPFSRDYLLTQIDAAVSLHKAKAIVLMAHYNCGAYGMHFPTHEEAQDYFAKQLEDGESIVKSHARKKGYNVRIIKIYADFTGAYEV